jgi:hypothetical protein
MTLLDLQQALLAKCRSTFQLLQSHRVMHNARVDVDGADGLVIQKKG